MRIPLHMMIGAFLGLATVHAPASDIPQPEPQFRDRSATIPFDLYGGYVIVAHGSLGPLKNLNFFLDTGTTRVVLDAQIAKRLNLPAQGPSNIVILGGRARGEDATLPFVEFGLVRATNLPVVTTDLSFFRRDLPVRIDAIIGLDVLGQAPFVIDYSAHVIRFGSDHRLTRSVPLRIDRGLAVFDAEIDHTPVHLLLDTGAFSLILFAKPSPQNSGVNNSPDPSPEDIGKFQSKQIRLRTLKFGPEEFRNEPAVLALGPKPPQFDFDGLMSPAALGISRISVDLKGGVLAFSR